MKRTIIGLFVALGLVIAAAAPTIAADDPKPADFNAGNNETGDEVVCERADQLLCR